MNASGRSIRRVDGREFFVDRVSDPTKPPCRLRSHVGRLSEPTSDIAPCTDGRGGSEPRPTTLCTYGQKCEILRTDFPPVFIRRRDLSSCAETKHFRKGDFISATCNVNAAFPREDITPVLRIGECSTTRRRKNFRDFMLLRRRCVKINIAYRILRFDKPSPSPRGQQIVHLKKTAFS